MLAIPLTEAQLDHGETLFSKPRFVNAVVQAVGNPYRLIELRSEKSGSTVCGLETVHSFGRRSIALSPFGLYAHPTGRDDLVASVRDFVAQLKGFATVTFEWNVRFDHELLAGELIRKNITFSRSATHALLLEGEYKRTFAKFNSTTRRYVRRSQDAGVLVRRTRDPNDIDAYYEVHRKLASQKGNYQNLYPKAMFDELVKLHEDVIFLIAEVETCVIGGAWFFRDGTTMFYWHGAMNREYARYYPSYAIQAYAIRMAHEEGRSTFNFGGSVGIASLEQFKSGWGAEPHYCWNFIWQNPLWRTVQRVRSSWRQHA